MSRDWSKYKEELIKRGEMLIDPEGFGIEAETEQTRKIGRPSLYQVRNPHWFNADVMPLII
jgi:hypothetical protein